MADEESSTTSEESLDATSDRFNPMKALYSTKLQVSSFDAPIYDNIAKFESVLAGIAGTTTKKNSKGSEQGECSKQRFLPHQEPVPGKPRDFKEGKNVLSKMQKTLGPLGMLYEYMESKTRVKVYTRNERGIRGHVEAYVAAFDKHWNLALEDCYEVWTRKVKRKAPALGAPSKCAEETKQDADVPKVIVRKIEGKRETLERHVPQMLLRGEQVAIIVKIN